MRLSVIILTHNQYHYTRQCLRSVTDCLANDSDTEIIVVDNGSTDRTIDMICESFPDVITIRLPQNRGIAYGRNTGIKASRGRHILLLDNDTIVNAKAIHTLEATLDNAPDIGICAPRLCDTSGKTQSSFKRYPGIMEKALNLLDRSRSSARDIPDGPIEPDYVIGACQMISREALNKTGLLDESIFFGPEDADLCIRMRQAGYRVVYLPSVHIIHHWQRSTAANPLSALGRKHIAALIHFYRKHHRWI